MATSIYIHLSTPQKPDDILETVKLQIASSGSQEESKDASAPAGTVG
jgi:hypothetical protein